MNSAVAETGHALAGIRRQISFVPVSLFGSASALGGLSADWRFAGAQFGLPAWAANIVLGFAVATLLVLSLVYLAKAFVSPAAIRQEFLHPVVGSLFGLIPLSLLAVSGSLAAFAPRVALAVWIVGAGSMILFTWIMVVRWVSAQQQAAIAHPAWMVAAGGILNVPLAIQRLGLTGLDEISILSLAVGLFLSIPIFTLILNRLLFQEPLAKALRPALMILTAPFSIGYLAYVAVSGGNDLFAHCLFMLDLFLTAVCLVLLVDLPLSCPFRISWWSVSFPLAASTGAALRFAAQAPGLFANATALVLLALTSAVIVWLAGRTIFGLATGELEAINK